MAVSRRAFLGTVPAALAAQSGAPAGFDRRAVVSRHNPTLRELDARSPLSVGNGEFAFTADPTGLQTFPEPYENQMPLCTQSQWGWHSVPNPTGKGAPDLRLTEFDASGRKVGYPTSSDGQKPLFDWLRENPHRLHLGAQATPDRPCSGGRAPHQARAERPMADTDGDRQTPRRPDGASH